MTRRKKSAPGLKVWLAAIALVYALFTLAEDEGALDRLIATAQPAGNTVTGTASVIDGDTLDIHGTRVRLHGIDAPESRQTCRRGDRAWRCGQQAALALSDRIGRQPVRCEEKDIDRYGRVVAACFVRGDDLNAWMAQQGWAVAYRRYGLDYVAQEDAARAARRGIWAGSFEMPWDWRAKNRR